MAAPDLWRKTVRTLLPDAAGVPDADLLARFRDARDEAAFELLLYRHGPMVWATCRRLLADRHAAEDAFQATFLALARRARSIRRNQSLPAWLHRVAVRAGLYLLRRSPRGAVPLDSHPDPVDRRPNPADHVAAADAAAHIDAAVNRLPERLRRVVVLCELQGHGLQEAAARLRCPAGTVASRLARARARLRATLSARGLAGGAVATTLVTELVPSEVRAAVLRTAVSNASVPPVLAALARRASRPVPGGMAWGLAGSLAAGVVAAAVALGMQGPPPAPKVPPGDPAPAAASRADAEGFPLPDGAVARLGSNRFRHGGSAGPAAFSGDGALLAAGDSRGIHVWDASTGRRLHHFPVPDRHWPLVIRFLADGSRLAAASSGFGPEAELALYDLAAGKVVDRTPFRGKHQLFIRDVTPDGSRVLVEDPAVKVYLWDRKRSHEEWAVDTPAAVSALPFTADGKRVGLVHTRGGDLVDATSGRVVGKFPDMAPRFHNAHTATLDRDGRLAACSFDCTQVGVYEAGRPDPVHTFPSDPTTTRLIFSPDARYLVAGGDGMSQVWDLTAPREKALAARLPGSAGAFSPDGKTLALDAAGAVSLWRVGAWTRLPQSADPGSAVEYVRFAADGKRVYGYTADGWVAWPATGGRTERLSDGSEIDPRGLAGVSADGRVGVDVLYRSGPAGKAGQYALRVTDFQTGKDRRIPVDPEPWRPVGVSDDGRFVWRFGFKEFAAWDAATGDVVFRQKRGVEDRLLVAVRLTPDGRRLARSVAVVPLVATVPAAGGPTVKGESAAFIIDHMTGRESKMGPAPANLSEARFSPDGTRLAVRASFPGPLADGGVSVWDTGSGRRLCAVPAVSGYPDTYALSADGRALLAGANDGVLRLVEVASGGERGQFRHAGVVRSVAFHPDGTKAVTSSPDAPVYVWDLLGDPGRWDAAKADAVWADLASPDAKVAFAAIRKLRANPAEAVAFLRDRVQLPAVPADETVAGWLKRLDAPAFADRERAQKELTEVADRVRPRLEAARKAAPSEEAARRLDQVLKSMDEMTPERLRAVRACEVLEGLVTPDAVRLLRAWAAGPDGARVTAEAKESLDRLKP